MKLIDLQEIITEIKVKSGSLSIPCQIDEDIMYSLSSDGLKLKIFMNDINNENFRILHFDKPITNFIIDRESFRLLIDFTKSDFSPQKLREIFDEHIRSNSN